MAKLFKDRDDWRRGLLSLNEATVLKMPRILQSVFYLLHYTREQVCQESTNKFFWKHAKKLLNETFLDRLVAYNPLGLKAEPVEQQPEYTTLNFIERNIEGLTLEDVEQQCGMYIAKLFKWLTLCIRTRKDDITYRKAQRRIAILSRDSLIQKEQER